MSSDFTPISGVAGAVEVTSDNGTSTLLLDPEWYQIVGDMTSVPLYGADTFPYPNSFPGKVEPVILMFGGTWNSTFNPFDSAVLQLGQTGSATFTINSSNTLTADNTLVVHWLIKDDADGVAVYECGLVGNWTVGGMTATSATLAIGQP